MGGSQIFFWLQLQIGSSNANQTSELQYLGDSPSFKYREKIYF